jgi:hypothetical protein
MKSQGSHNYGDASVLYGGPDRYEIATEVLSSAVRILLAAGFYESEVLRLFEQVARKKERAPVWLTPLEDEPIGGRP